MDSPNCPYDIRVVAILVARLLLSPVAQNFCKSEHGVFTSRTCLCSQTLHSAAARQAFNNPYANNKAHNKPKIHQMLI
jgi:hypothetical protein